MDYQVKYNKFLKGHTFILSKGFSLVELIVVIGIFAILLNVSTSTYNSFKSHSNLEVATGAVVEAIRFAESSAQSGKNDAKWGVEILSNQIVIFKGNSYATRDTPFDQNLSFAGEVTASGLGEIVFEKLTGTTSMTGTIILTNGTDNKNINVNEKGTVTY